MKKKKNNRVILAEPEVSSGIKMDISHNDLVDVAIQTNLENLEAEEKDLRESLERLDESYNTFTKSFLDKAIEEGKIIFMKMLKKLDITREDLMVYENPRFRGEKLKYIEFPFYKEIDMLHMERYYSRKKNITLKDFDEESKRCRNKSCPIGYGEELSVSFKVDQKTFWITSQPILLKISKKEQDLFVKTSTEYAEAFSGKKQRIWEIQREKLDYQVNEKKIKARVIKMSLSKTEEGKNILNLLQSATNVKLLN